MDNLKNSLVLLQPTPADAKSCNWYVSGGNVVIETIKQYLERVPVKQRSPEDDVTMLFPKSGYESLGVYTVAEFKGGILSNFEGKKYAFVGGLTDDNFIALSRNDKNYHHIQLAPSRVWEVMHNLNKYPSVTITDIDGNEYESEVRHINTNNLLLTFSVAFAGFADLN